MKLLFNNAKHKDTIFKTMKYQYKYSSLYVIYTNSSCMF